MPKEHDSKRIQLLCFCFKKTIIDNETLLPLFFNLEMSRAPLRWQPPEGREKINWETITGLPLGEYEKGERDISALDKLIDHALKFKIEETDRHFSDGRFSSSLARLYRLLLSKCDYDANEYFSKTAEQGLVVEKLKEQLSVAEDRVQRHLDEKSLATQAMQTMEEGQEAARIERTKLASQIQELTQDLRNKDRELEKHASDLETIRKELNRMTRERDDLRRASESRVADVTRSDADRNKIFDENQFLIKRYKEASDKLAQLSDSFAALQRDHMMLQGTCDSDLTSLRSQLAGLQQENLDLIQARNRAEDLCERRETQALEDMSELQLAYKQMVGDEQRRYQQLREEYMQLRDEFELSQRHHTHVREVEERDEVIAQLKNEIRQLRSSYRHQGDDDSDVSSTTTPQSTTLTVGADINLLNKVLAERQKLEQENDTLQGELAALEVKCEQQDSQILKLQKRLTEYERGDEGLRRLRQELLDANRTTEQLQDEAQQLRERLAHMEDVASFCTSLKMLCRRVGVTQEEIDRLQGSTNSRFGELDILRQETSSLKEEIEWLEKERRYWMNKVRLQPLLDTRLRFELGLTSEQLKQLDQIVDQMKVGSVVVEDTEGVYREKYLHEVRERQRDIEEFNDKMRSRIEEVLSTVMNSVLGAAGATGENCGPTSLQNFVDVVDEMRRRSAETAMAVAGAAVSSAAGAREQQQLPEGFVAAFQPTKQLESLRSKLDEVERLNNDLLGEASRLREKIAGVEGQLASITEERDAYRAIVFDAAQASGNNAATGASIEQDPMPVPHGSRISMSSVEQGKSFQSPVRRLGIGNEIVPLLKEQLKMKELRLQQLASEYDAVKALADSSRLQFDGARKECEVLEARLRTLNERAASITSTLQMSSERISELEKLNEELQRAVQTGELAPSSRDLLQKIVLLRQREAKLLQRLRIASQERDEAMERQAVSYKNIESSLSTLKDVMRGESEGCILPPSTAQHASETEALRVLQRQLTALSQGSLFTEDKKFLRDMRDVVEKLETVCEVSVLQKQLRAVKLDAERQTVEAQEKVLEMEGIISKLRNAGAAEPSSGAAAMEVEANTWRQKCVLYAKRIADRDADVAQLEDALGAARQLVVECKQEIVAAANTPTNPGMTNDASNRSNDDHQSPQSILKYEKEVARLKSVNLGLLQTSLDLQADKKRLEIQLTSTKKHLQLVKDAQGGGSSSQVVSDFVVSALRDNSNLQQQCELAQYQLKKTRLQLLATESNFRVVANEAGAYKLSAHRLFKHYAEQVVKIVDSVRHLQRENGTALSARRAAVLTQRLVMMQKLADREHDRFVNEKIGAVELHSHIDILKDELDLLAAKTEGGQKMVDGSERSKTIELRAQVKSLQRKNQELVEEREYIQLKLSRAEQNLCDTEREVARAEASGQGVVGEVTDVFFAKLQELRDTVFAKSESPPVALTMSTVHSSPKGLEDGDKAVQEFKDALEKQADLSKRCALLQQQLSESRQSLSMAESKTTAMREETIHLQHQLAAASQQLEEERGRLVAREQRLAASHQNQLEVMQRAVDHNTQCLKDLLSGKEVTIQRLQQQLQTERQRYLEHQLLDTTRMERLHDQLFKENNNMLERFKASMEINGAAQSHGAASARSADGNTSSAIDSAHQQIQKMTQEVLQLRLQAKELRTRNIMLESQLNDQISASQRQLLDMQRPASGGNAVIEHSLAALNRDQNAALENIRRREHELLTELQRSQEEVKRLHNEVFDLRSALIDQADAANRNSQGHIAMSSAPTLASEMKLQIAELQNQLQEARSHLSYEKAHSRHASSQSEEFKKAMRQLEHDVTQGTVHVDHARQVLAANSQLRADLDAMRDQSDKMQNAMSMLKLTLVQQTQSSGEREQKLQQEVAIAQRMSVLQQQASDTIAHLQSQIASMQNELQSRVHREEELLRKGKSAQLFAEEQHRLLIQREKELVDLKREIQHLRTKGSRARSSGPMSWKDASIQVITSELNPAAFANTSSQYVQLAGGNPPIVPPQETIKLLETPAQSHPPPPPPPAAEPQPAPQPPNSTVEPVTNVPQQCDAQKGSETAVHARNKSGKKPKPESRALEVLPSNEQVAGLVSRQLSQLQKEKQGEVDQLKQQLRKLEASTDETARQFTVEKTNLEHKLHSATSTTNALKAKLELVESQHREEMLRFLEERHSARRPSPSGVPTQKKRSLRGVDVVKEQGVQTDGPTRPASQLDIPKVPGLSAPTSASKIESTKTSAQPVVGDRPDNTPQAPEAPKPSKQAESTTLGAGALTMSPQPTAETPQSKPAKQPEGATRAITISSSCQTDGTGPVSSAFGETKSHQTKKWVDLQSASSDLKVQEMVRRLRRENDRMSKELAEHAAAQKETDALRSELKKVSTELDQMKVAQRVTASNDVPATPFEIRSHKRELLRMEEYVDQLRRDLNVKKEIELRGLVLNNERLTNDMRRLEAENAKLRGGALPSSVEQVEADAGGSKIRELENKLLTQEGVLLDLRFERETLSMKVMRLERHLSDVMAVDSAASKAPAPHGSPGAHGTNVGRKRDPTSGKEVAALEGVIENMKLVVERMQAENMNLKANSVGSAQFMEAAREVKHLRQRERALLERCQEQHRHIEELQAAVLPGSKMSEQYSVLQRRLRMSQAAVEQHQLELFELRSRLGEQQRQSAVQFAEGEKEVSPHILSPQHTASTPTRQDVPSGMSNAGLSPYAAERHRHLPHHLPTR